MTEFRRRRARSVCNVRATDLQTEAIESSERRIGRHAPGFTGLHLFFLVMVAAVSQQCRTLPAGFCRRSATPFRPASRETIHETIRRSVTYCGAAVVCRAERFPWHGLERCRLQGHLSGRCLWRFVAAVHELHGCLVP